MAAAVIHLTPAVRHRALRVSEARYRGLFETAQDGILLLNPTTGQIEDVNPYLLKMLGYSHNEFLGKKLWEVGAFADVPISKEGFCCKLCCWRTSRMIEGGTIGRASVWVWVIASRGGSSQLRRSFGPCDGI
jgi:PAS domain-containing protein